MVHSGMLRRVLLALTGLVFLGVAVRTLLSPDTCAGELGYVIQSANGYSELFAVSLGTWGRVTLHRVPATACYGE